MRWGRLPTCFAMSALLLLLVHSGVRPIVGLTFAAEPATAPSDPPTTTAAPAAAKPADKTDGKQLPRQTRVTISKATTYITEPLRDDGYPDYVAALNAMSSQGVTPKNNAVVVLWRAFGPRDIEEKYRADYFKQLGIEPLPERGDYFVDFFKFTKNLPVPEGIGAESKDANPKAVDPNDADPKSADPKRADPIDLFSLDFESTPLEDYYYRRWEQSESRPWTSKEFPEIAAWLIKNEKPLALIVEASERKHYFSPIVENSELPLLGAISSLPINTLRQAAQSLLTRAMLRIGEGDLSAAADDLLATHRLARLSCQKNCVLIEHLIGFAVDGIATTGEQQWLSSAKLTADVLAKYTKSYHELPPFPPISRAFEIGERFFFLDAVCAMARNSAGSLQHIAGLEATPRFGKLFDLTVNLGIDWDIPLQDGNAWYDRLAKACQVKDAKARATALTEFDDHVRRLDRRIKGMPSLVEMLNPRKNFSQRMSHIFSALFLPSLTAAVGAENRMRTEHSAMEISFALRAYKIAKGRFPDKLDALVPDYIATIPADAFGDRPFVYKPAADGKSFMLYSVGRNGKDDAGRGYADQTEGGNDDFDDIAVQIPAPPPKPVKGEPPARGPV